MFHTNVFFLFSFVLFFHQFVDLCILLGCDYCDKIKGLGPKKALKLIQKHHTIENVVLHINRQVEDHHNQWSMLLFHAYSFTDENEMIRYYLLSCRSILCHNSGSTEKHGRYSWMYYKPQFLNSSGLSQMKKPWLSSSVTTDTLSMYSSKLYFAFISHASVSLSEMTMNCIHVALFLGRTESVIEWRCFVRSRKVCGRSRKRKEQQDIAGKLA